MLPNLGVAEDHRLEVLRILRTAQADETVLAAKTRGFGWNVVGPQYRELHALFLRQYAEEQMARLDRLGHASSKADEGPRESPARLGWDEIPSSAPADAPLSRRP